MLDPKRLRQALTEVAANLKKRGFELPVEVIEALESERKDKQQLVQDLQHKRNDTSKQIGMAKAKGEDVSQIMADVARLGDDLKVEQEALEALQTKLHDIYATIPNLLHESVPVGHSEDDNQLVRSWGDKPSFDFTPKEHHSLTEKMDFQLSAKLTGSRFVVLKDDLARLHRALVSFMLDVQTMEHGYQERYVPYIVNEHSLSCSGHLPKFKDDLFKIEGLPYYLIPTAEVPLANTYQDTIVKAEELPIKLCAHTPCFRSEAGSYGKDTHGMIRQHQFEKVELVAICHPEQSYKVLEQMTLHAEAILQKLNLSYRVMNLCAGDIGFAAAKTYDLEVWLPGQQAYREISSCSNCEDFQARRLLSRFRVDGKPSLVHTLNGSGLAVGRTLIAILENYQQGDGSVLIPEALQPYMGGKEVILKK